ncbi:MAG: WbqC family protein [Firmicutes bacterium]|nr:WbqC family protein [Bacillota bacterium]
MTKKVAILQSNYIPWKGYFDIINMVDEFILFDDVQYTKNDWRNRNKIKTHQGLQWLSIPVLKEKLSQKICETKIANPKWSEKHWKTIMANYSKAEYFNEYEALFEELYRRCAEEQFLSQINYKFIKLICEILKISTRISWSMDYGVNESDRSLRLLRLCQEAGAGHYLSGPAAKAYLNESVFEQQGVTISYMDYSDYKEYPQLFGPFEHGVTILDLLFNTGSMATQYMRSFT